MTTLENAFEFHERGLKDVMEDPMEGYRYQTLRDSQHGSRVSNTFTPSGINSAERKFVIRSQQGLIPHLAKVRMSFKIVKNNAAYGYADLINTDHVTMFSRRELRIGGKTVEDVDNMAVEKVVDTLMNYSLEYEKTAGSNQFIYLVSAVTFWWHSLAYSSPI